MLIMLDAKWIERVPLGYVNSLDGPLSLGLQRNKIMLPYPRPKRSISPPVVVVHNYFGCDNVTMKVPSRLVTTLVSILEPNT
jgi:hypothetical protein